MIVYNGNIVVNNGRWIIPERMKYKVNLIQTEGGTISAVPVTGINGVTVTLSNTPNQYYTFNGYTVNGATLYGGNKFDFDNSDVTVSASFNYYNPYNPLNLPPNTVRVRTSDGNVPKKGASGGYDATYETATLVPGTTDVYDVYKSGTDFTRLLKESSNVVEVLGANTTGITDMDMMFCYCPYLITVPLFDTSNVTEMKEMFRGCTSLSIVPLFDTYNVTDMYGMFMSCSALQSVPLFDTSKVTDMGYMFDGCSILRTIPLFDTSKVKNMNRAFYQCTNVESGALALYKQASTQTKPPSNHTWTFYDCGSNTQTGAAELAQIPSNWK